MVDLAQAPVEVEIANRRRLARRTWVRLLICALLVGGGTVAAVSISLRYLHAPRLAVGGGGWLPPDDRHARTVSAGPYIASVVAPRAGRPQTFEMELYNPSSVTQTVLGLTDAAALGDPRMTAEPEHLSISTRPTFPQRGTTTYSSGPVDVGPHQQFGLRLTQDTGHGWAACRSEYWTSLSLQVRVGPFTRTERVDFGNLVLELRKVGPNC